METATRRPRQPKIYLYPCFHIITILEIGLVQLQAREARKLQAAARQVHTVLCRQREVAQGQQAGFDVQRSRAYNQLGQAAQLQVRRACQLKMDTTHAPPQARSAHRGPPLSLPPSLALLLLLFIFLFVSLEVQVREAGVAACRCHKILQELPWHVQREPLQGLYIMVECRLVVKRLNACA